MTGTNVVTLLFIIFIISIFIDILIPNKKKRRNYNKKTKKLTEKQKLVFFGIIALVFLSIYIINLLINSVKFISNNIIEVSIILLIIGIFLFIINFLINMFFPNIHYKMKNMFKRKNHISNYNDDFKHYEKKQNNYNTTYEKPTYKKEVNTNEIKTDEHKETKKLEEMIKNINIKEQETQNNMYNTIKQNKPKKSNPQIGKEYEKQVGEFYENLGYKVKYHGIEKRKKDNGIDLIATADNKTLFIQCKNNQKSIIKQIKLKEFIGNCTEYIEKNPNKYKNIKRIFVVAKDNKDFGTKKYIENNKSIEFKVIPYIDI